jgi:hypothetical protein
MAPPTDVVSGILLVFGCVVLGLETSELMVLQPLVGAPSLRVYSPVSGRPKGIFYNDASGGSTARPDFVN